MITKKIHVWLASADIPLATRIARLVKTAFDSEITVYTMIPGAAEVAENFPAESILLVDNRLLNLPEQLDQFEGNFPDPVIIILQSNDKDLNESTSHALSKYPTVPSGDELGRILIQTIKLTLEKQFKNWALLALARTASQISEARSITEIMETTCRAIVRLFEVDHCGFVQFDDDQNHGWAMAEYPEIGSKGAMIPVQGIPAEMQVVHEGKLFESLNVLADNRLGSVRDRLTEKEIRSILIIPVRVGKTVTASFSLDTLNRTMEFSTETKDLCLTLANQVGIAIKNLRRDEEIKYLRGAMDAIQQITSRSAEGKLQETLQSIVDLACKNLEVHIATLYTYDQTHDCFVIGVGSGCSKGTMADPNQLTKDSSLYRILEDEDFQKTEDAPNHAAFKGGFVEKEKILSSFGMKIMNERVPVGVLFINFRGPRPHHFREEEIRTYLEFGNQAAVVINNAQLQSQNKKRLLALEGLYAVGEQMPEYDLENSLNRIAKTALDIMKSNDEKNKNISHIAVLNGHFLDFFVASSPEVLENLKSKVGRIDLEDKNSRIGIVGKAILEENSLNIGDVKKDPTYGKYYIEYGSDITSQITALLRVRGRIFGTLSVESTNRNAFNQEDRRNLEHLAHYAEMVLLNSRQFTLTDSLIAAGDKLTSAKRLSSVLEDISKRVRNMFGCDLVSIYMLSPENQISYPGIFSGKRFHPDKDIMHPELRKTYTRRIPLARIEPGSVLPKLLEIREPVYCSEGARKHPILGSGNFVEREKIEAAAAIPLMLKRGNQDQIVGFLFLNFRKKRLFHTQELNEIKIFGQYLAHAIEYFRQYDELLEMRGTIGGINVVTWMNHYSEGWQKLAGDMATKIKSSAILVKQQLAKQANGDEVDLRESEKYIGKIKEYADQIRKNTVPPRSYEIGYKESDCQVDTVLKRIVKHLKTKNDVGVIFKIKTPQNHIEIRADQEWLWHGFVNLLEYSIESMKDSAVKKLEIHIVELTSQVRVTVSDTGQRSAPCNAAVSSVSRDEAEDLFRFRWQTAKAIFALYDGAITCSQSGTGNTAYEVTFPIPKNKPEAQRKAPHRV